MNTNIVFLLMLPKFSLAIIPECKSVEENVVCTLVTHYDKDVPPPTIGNQPVSTLSTLTKKNIPLLWLLTLDFLGSILD